MRTVFLSKLKKTLGLIVDVHLLINGSVKKFRKTTDSERWSIHQCFAVFSLITIIVLLYFSFILKGLYIIFCFFVHIEVVKFWVSVWFLFYCLNFCFCSFFLWYCFYYHYYYFYWVFLFSLYGCSCGNCQFVILIFVSRLKSSFTSCRVSQFLPDSYFFVVECL